MKNKLVIWGTDPQEEKVLIALELVEENGNVRVYLIPGSAVTETLEQDLMKKWRNGSADVEFPEGTQISDTVLNVTGNLLPEGYKTAQTDLVNRAQVEWNFALLSNNVAKAYKEELDQIKAQIEALSAYDSGQWNQLKDFWTKVQGQIHGRTLLRQHTSDLKQTTNKLFDKLKELRTSFEKDFKEGSKSAMDEFQNVLGDIETRIEKDARLNSIFEELKKVQNRIKKADMTRDHRNKIWTKLDELFNTVKERKYGSGGKSGNDRNSPLSRTVRRLDGLDKAIDRMEKSIKYDKRELDFQENRVNQSGSQLEVQLRDAKMIMIKEKISSKMTKLEDMLETKKALTAKIEQLKLKEEAQKAKREKEAELAKAKDDIKERIKDEIKEREESATGPEAEKLAAAAQAFSQTKKSKSVKKDAQQTINDSIEDAEDFLTSAAGMLADSVESLAETLFAVGKEAKKQLDKKVEEVTEDLKAYADGENPKSEANEIVEIDKVVQEDIVDTTDESPTGKPKIEIDPDSGDIISGQDA